MTTGKKGKGKVTKGSSRRQLPDDVVEDFFEDEHRGEAGNNRRQTMKKNGSVKAATTTRASAASSANKPKPKPKPNKQPATKTKTRSSSAAKNALFNDDNDDDDDIEEFIDDYDDSRTKRKHPPKSRSFRSSPACPTTRTVPTTRGTTRQDSDSTLASTDSSRSPPRNNYSNSNGNTPRRAGVSRANSTRSNASFKSSSGGVTRTNSSRVKRANSTRSLKSQKSTTTTRNGVGVGVSRTNSTRSLKSQKSQRNLNGNGSNNRRSTLKSQQSKSQRSVTSHTSRTTTMDRSSSRRNNNASSSKTTTTTTKWQRPSTMFSSYAASGGQTTTSRTKSREEHLRDLLGQGAYHLPGHNWWQDWLQYFGNNHPLFCPFLQHPLHPVSRCIKAVQLVGSIMVGLVLTNVIYLLVIYEAKDQLTIELEGGGNSTSDRDNIVLLGEEGEEPNEIIGDYTQIQLDPGMWVLWTVGGAIHAIWDNTVWYATACACFDSQLAWVRQYKRVCNFLVIIFVTGLIAAGTLAILIRAHVEGGGVLDADTLTAGVGGEHTKAIADTQNYVFLMSYAVELAVAWFLWFPIIESILFTGIMGKCCPCIPFLGGRPGEVKAEEEYQQQQVADLERGTMMMGGRSRSRRY